MYVVGGLLCFTDCVLVEKARMDSGIGLLLYKKICAHINSPPQSSIMYNLASSHVQISKRHLGAPNLTGLMCALLVRFSKLYSLNLLSLYCVSSGSHFHSIIAIS